MLATFPRGLSGAGLLTLRVTVAIAVIIVGSIQLASGPFSVISLGAIVLAILITIGLFTSHSSATVAVLIVALFFAFHSGLIIKTVLAALCVSISLTGAGAYSIDGLSHGRRRIILPKSSQRDHLLNKPHGKRSLRKNHPL